jgi:hypothetical protein
VADPRDSMSETKEGLKNDFPHISPVSIIQLGFSGVMNDSQSERIHACKVLIAQEVGPCKLEEATSLLRDLDEEELKETLENFVKKFFPKSTIVY